MISGTTEWLCTKENTGHTSTTLMSGTNDGDRVSAKTAKAWGEAILIALKENRIKQVTVKDKTYEGGKVSWPSLKGEPLNNSDKKWLTGLAKFFIKSGGFAQW